MALDSGARSGESLQLKPFHPPTTIWAIVCIPLALLLLILNIYSLYSLIISGYLTDLEKFLFSIEVTLLMAIVYLLVGYYYHRWAYGRKNELLQVAIKNSNILYEKYGRITVNADKCKEIGSDPLRFSNLSQSDLREVKSRLGI